MVINSDSACLISLLCFEMNWILYLRYFQMNVKRLWAPRWGVFCSQPAGLFNKACNDRHTFPHFNALCAKDRKWQRANASEVCLFCIDSCVCVMNSLQKSVSYFRYAANIVQVFYSSYETKTVRLIWIIVKLYENMQRLSTMVCCVVKEAS